MQNAYIHKENVPSQEVSIYIYLVQNLGLDVEKGLHA
jgi:hypothetical protein